MFSASCPNPATRRLVDHYLLIALASILAGVLLIVWFHWQGSLDERLSFAVAAELGIVIVGILAVRRSVATMHSIEYQLRSVAMNEAERLELSPLAQAGGLAKGWNVIVGQLQNHQALTSLESHLCELHGSSDEKQWNLVFHAVPEGIAVCDCDEQIVQSNHALAAIFGFESGTELINRDLPDLLSSTFPAHQPGNTAPVASAHSRAPQTFELHRGSQAADGILRVNRIPLTSAAGIGQGFLWCFRDITQQRLAEESRNQFVFTATHELRTPLANIKAYADTLADADDIDVDDQKRFYNIISNEATRLARFVDELLDVSQLESGTILATRSETDIERLIQETIENLRPQLLQKELKFETRLAPKIPGMFVDKDKLIAALVNLMGNAIKYTPAQGTVRLIVEPDDTSLSFHVEDTGIGISPEELPRISEKFFRSQDQRVQSLVGSGLGLAYAQQVARLHGGKLSVKSQLDKGSRFSLIIPLV